MRLLVTLLVLGTLAGCTVKYDLSGADWNKPGVGIQTVTLDEMECVRAAREAGSTPELWIGGIADIVRQGIEESQRGGAYRSCMQAKGYQPSS